MTIPNHVLVLTQDPRFERSQLKIFIGSCLPEGRQVSPYEGKPGVTCASWKCLPQVSGSKIVKYCENALNEITEYIWEYRYTGEHEALENLLQK